MLPDAFVDELRELAERRHEQPQDVLVRATEILGSVTDTRILARTHWVIGLALHELGRPHDAVVAYEQAVQLSGHGATADIEALSRASLAISLLSSGDRAGADAQMARAQAVSPADTRGVVAMLGGLLLQRTGRLDAALVAYRSALRLLEEADDRPSMARLLLNRGTLLAYQGQPQRALKDLEAAEQLARTCKLPVLVAMAAHNTGFAHGRRGHLPDALSAFARAEQAYADLQHPGLFAAVLQADRCEILLSAGLVAEARLAAEVAVAGVVGSGDIAYLSECMLLLARALLASGSYRMAADTADQAARDFRRSRRLPWVALAHYVSVQAEILLIEDQLRSPPGLLARCRRLAAELEGQGWPLEAVHVRTFAARVALSLHQPERARQELARALPARRRGSAEGRAQAWHARALLALAEGDRTAARRALSCGMQVVAEHLATLGATELRARAGSLGGDLARLGLRLALDDGRPAEVLRWAEDGRAASLRRPPIHPPDDAELAAELAELRRVRSELRDAALQGEELRPLERQAVSLETTVRHRLRQIGDGSKVTRRSDLPHIRRALSDRVLIEYVGFEGRLYAITVRRGRARLHLLGMIPDIEEEQQYLLFAMRRQLEDPVGNSVGPVLAATARRIEELLLEPLALHPEDSLVIVPTGVLHGLAWFALPSMAPRIVTIAPSAALWAESPQWSAAEPSRGPGPVTLVAGPELPGALQEVQRLAQVHHAPRVLSGAAANAANVLDALGRSDLVHLAAHGRFRADSPFFSAILLDDGLMTIYDLARVRKPPRTVVLASCDGARSAVEAGDEVLGTAAALIALGVEWVIAPVIPIPDAQTAGFMVGLHRALASGCLPPRALAEARRDDRTGVGSAFVCIGRNERDQVGKPRPQVNQGVTMVSSPG